MAVSVIFHACVPSITSSSSVMAMESDTRDGVEVRKKLITLPTTPTTLYPPHILIQIHLTLTLLNFTSTT